MISLFKSIPIFKPLLSPCRCETSLAKAAKVAIECRNQRNESSTRTDGEMAQILPFSIFNKSHVRNYHDELLRSTATQDIVLYSDGSVKEGGAGAGIAVRTKSKEKIKWKVMYRSIGPGNSTTSIGAELVALGMALEHLSQLNLKRINFTRAFIFTDSVSAIRGDCGRRDKSGIAQIARNKALISRIRFKYPSLDIHVNWIPGHSGILGNQLADRMAKKGATIHTSMKRRFDLFNICGNTSTIQEIVDSS